MSDSSQDHPLAAVRDLFAGHDRDRVEESLNLRKVPELRTVAREFGWHVRGQRRADILAQLAQHYTSASSAEMALDQLSELERRVLSLAAWVGRADVDKLVEAISGLIEILPAGWAGAAASGIPVYDLVHDLARRGYLLEVRSAHGMYEMAPPRAFGRCLLPIDELTPCLDVVGSRDVAPALDVAPARDPVSDLIASWRAVDARAPIDVVIPFGDGITFHGPSRWPVSAGLDRSAAGSSVGALVQIPPAGHILPELPAADVAKAVADRSPDLTAFWATLLIGTEALAYVDDRTKRDTRNPALTAVLESGPDDLLAHLVGLWLLMPYGVWDELSWLQLRGSDWVIVRADNWWRYRPQNYYADLGGMRRLLLRILGTWPRSADSDSETPEDEAWVDLDSFSKAVHAAFHDDVVPGASISPWYAANPGDLTPLAPSDPEDWARCSGSVLQYVLHGPLRWLGLVETAAGGDAKLVAARLTAIGCALVDGRPMPLPDPMPLKWLDGFRVVVDPCIANGARIAALSIYAAAAEPVRGSLCYRFTAEASRAAFDAGLLPQDVAHELARAGVSVPEALLAAISAWWESWGRLRRYDELTLIELADETLMRELLATTDLAQWLVAQVSPTALVVETAAVPELVASMESAGHTPRVLGEVGAEPEADGDWPEANGDWPEADGDWPEAGWDGAPMAGPDGDDGWPPDSEEVPPW